MTVIIEVEICHARDCAAIDKMDAARDAIESCLAHGDASAMLNGETVAVLYGAADRLEGRARQIERFWRRGQG